MQTGAPTFGTPEPAIVLYTVGRSQSVDTLEILSHIPLLASVLFYFGFSALSELALFQNGVDYYLEMLGINFHYQSIKQILNTLSTKTS